MKKIFFTIFFFATITGYFAQNNLTTQDEKFALLLLKISKKNNEYTFSKTSLNLVNGVYKGIADTAELNNEEKFILSVSDDNQREIINLPIKNPLETPIEHPGDSTSLAYTNLNIPDTELLIRFKYNAEMKQVSIKKMSIDRNVAIITTFPISFNK